MLKTQPPFSFQNNENYLVISRFPFSERVHGLFPLLAFQITLKALEKNGEM